MSILRVMIALALPASNCFLSFSNSRLNSPQRINLPRESNSFTNVRSRCTSNTSPVELKDYLVEFRATNDLFRLDEFRDCAQCCGVDYELTFRPVIIDMFTTEPVCTYVRLPNDKVAQQIAARSCIIRSIIEVWGDSVDLHELVNTTTTSYMNEFKIHFKTIPSEKNTWRINFRHYGKSGYSGMSYREKVEFLKNFNEVFTDINGQVDLSTPNTKLVYMEDWFDYQNSTNVFYQQTLEANSEEDIEKAKEVLKSYVPRRRLFGRLVAKGPKIASTYDVRTRPYIGTTTMDALVSHITANAAHVMEGDLVLDPFCGTGSLLLPCAFLGADVMGSDIDADCLGLVDRDLLTYSDRSKNSNFVRLDGLKNEQLSGSTRTNFEYYGLLPHLKGLFGVDAMKWCTEELGDFQFDAIISDPPFGIRERTKGESSGQPLVVLFAIAAKRLKLGGRLAFWLPTEAFLSQDDVLNELTMIQQKSSTTNVLLFKRAVRQELSSRLWRWLCVFTKERLI